MRLHYAFEKLCSVNSLLVLCGLLRSTCSVALVVAQSACTSKRTILCNRILTADGLAVEMALKNLTDTFCIAELGRQRSARDVRGHAMVGHRTPWVILRCWLRKPDISSIACKLSIFQCLNDHIPVANLPSSCVDNV